MSSFEIVDRRRENKIIVDDPLIQKEQAALGSDVWDGEIVDVVALMPQQDESMIVMGRSIGLRGDGVPICADFWFESIWPRERDWTVTSRKRLGTFLGCKCKNRTPCSVHKMLLPQWIQQDIQRIQLSNAAPIPKVLQVFLQVEMAAQKPSILVPQR